MVVWEYAQPHFTSAPFVRCLISYLSTVAELVAFWLALMGADQELQVVLLQKFLCHIGPKVAATSSDCIYYATLLRHGVTPQYIYNLKRLERFPS